MNKRQWSGGNGEGSGGRSGVKHGGRGGERDSVCDDECIGRGGVRCLELEEIPPQCAGCAGDFRSVAMDGNGRVERSKAQ